MQHHSHHRKSEGSHQANHFRRSTSRSTGRWSSSGKTREIKQVIKVAPGQIVAHCCNTFCAPCAPLVTSDVRLWYAPHERPCPPHPCVSIILIIIILLLLIVIIIHAYTYIYIYICECVCMCIYMYIYMCIYKYI